MPPDRPIVPREKRRPIGWREWVALPDWGVDHLKAKIDTGARTSSLHATDVERFERDGAPWVGFTIHPWQRTDDDPVRAEAPVIEERTVRSSSGDTDHRPVVIVRMVVGGTAIPAEMTLTNRDDMGFRMLVGRQAVRGTFVVDPYRSYTAGRPPRAVRRLNRGRDPEAEMR